MRLTMRHTLDTDPDTFWTKLFFDEDYTRRMFKEGLEARAFDLLELKEEPFGKSRRLRVLPKGEPPRAVKALLGDPESIEEGRFEADKKKWSFKITPPKLADKIKISGEITLSPLPNGKSERLTQVDINVDIFGVGGVVEGFIEKTVRENYDRSATFTNKYVAEKGLGPK